MVRFWTVVACAAAVMAGLSSATELSDRQELQKRTQSIENCFAARISELRSLGELEPSQDTQLRDVFIFEQIEKHLLGAYGKPGLFFTDAPGSFCEEHLVKPYLDAVAGARKRQKDSNPDILAPAGMRPIESDSFFIQSTQNLTGRHIKGHSDITEEAIDRMPSQLRFNPTARELVSRASQAPDLYRWSQERYHAHTPHYQPSDRSDRSHKILQGKRTFQELLNTSLRHFQKYAGDGAFDRALFVLGSSLHAVQDLVYHRGMTLQQHAGLSYVVNRNPDTPMGAQERKRFDEAIGLTLNFVESSFSTLAIDARAGLLSWKPSDDFSFQDLARSIFSGREDIGVMTLISYWELSGAYRSGERPLQELAQSEDCSDDNGLACWIPSDVLGGLTFK